MNHIDLIGQIADLKDTDYKNTLAITVLIDLFIEKGLFTREDFAKKSRELEKLTVAEIIFQRRHEGFSAFPPKRMDSNVSQLHESK